MIALCRAIRVVCLHDVSMIVIGVKGADQGEEQPSHHHMAPGMSYPVSRHRSGLKVTEVDGNASSIATAESTLDTTTMCADLTDIHRLESTAAGQKDWFPMLAIGTLHPKWKLTTTPRMPAAPPTLS
jgi:hypothetical protein